MKSQLDIDNQRLGQRAFQRHLQVGDLLQKLHFFLASILFKPVHALLITIKEWILTPYTLWPIDFQGLGRFVCNELENNRELDPQMKALLHLVETLPSQTEQNAVDQHEHCVEAGDYPLVRNHAKYRVAVEKLLARPEFHSDLKLIDDLFGLSQYENHRGIIRRTVAGERNFRFPEFFFKWDTEARRFQHVFDAFCYKYDLYGLEKGQPLLMKVTVNLTAMGMIIFIPKWMSLDLGRDLVIKSIAKLQQARGVQRQGAKLSVTQMEKEANAKSACLADEAAAKLNLKGEKRWDFVRGEVGLSPLTGRRQLQKLIQLGKELSKTQPQSPVPPATPVPPAESARIQRARAALNVLTPEEKAELLKSLGA